MANTDTDLTPTKLARAAGISVPYASQLLKKPGSDGSRTASLQMAIKIFRATGHKLAPIADATEEEIATLERFQGAA
jgi:hypothetical protein